VANMDMMITRRFILFDERFVIGVRLKRRNHVVDRDLTRWLWSSELPADGARPK
jgi:hypothetical protein